MFRYKRSAMPPNEEADRSKKVAQALLHCLMGLYPLCQH